MKEKRSFLFIAASIIFAMFIAFGCDSDDTNPASGTSALVGTWDMTSITSTVEGLPVTINASDLDTWILLIPELAMVPRTLTLNEDGTYQLTYVDTEVEAGTWTATESVLSVTPQGEITPIPLPYTLSGNTATINMTAENEGEFFEVELVFTKR